MALSGELVRLRSTADSDRAALVAIRSSEVVHRRWRGDDLEAEFDEEQMDEEVHRFTIEDIGGTIVGLVQYAEEDDPEYRHASIDIYIDPAVHRLGYATDAIRVLCDYLFDVRGHHRLTIDPAADNEAAIACYSKVGFTPVGVMRSYELGADGSWVDGLLMDMLAGDRPTGG
ncbi:MAG: GNAT family protein [Acidimicrobiia bacterium]|nr:GNAT family protein [Acidimicrobiia bacterium]